MQIDRASIRKRGSTYQIIERAFFLFFMILVLVGCRGMDTSRYTRNKPLKTHLVGTWVPEEGAFPEKIIIRADETFTRFSVLEDGRKVISASGTWYLDNVPGDGDDRWWEIGFNSDQKGDYAANLCSGNPPYLLEFVSGNPNDPEYSYFHRDQSK